MAKVALAAFQGRDDEGKSCYQGMKFIRPRIGNWRKQAMESLVDIFKGKADRLNS